LRALEPDAPGAVMDTEPVTFCIWQKPPKLCAIMARTKETEVQQSSQNGTKAKHTFSAALVVIAMPPTTWCRFRNPSTLVSAFETLCETCASNANASLKITNA
jgi:hypothetical protein